MQVQVDHPRHIKVPVKRLWRLFKKATPQHAWEDVAVSLACLESLYRVEFSQAAEECIAAYNAANSAPVPADAEAKGVQQQQGGEQAGDEVAAAASAAVKAVTTAVAAATNSGEAPPEQRQPSDEELMQAAAEQADTNLAAHITFLANRSHFQAFTRRDCELGKTLNQGYQGQLFIQSNNRKLDKSLLQAFTASYGACRSLYCKPLLQAMGPTSVGDAQHSSTAPEHGPDQQVVQGSLGVGSVGAQHSGRYGLDSDQQKAQGDDREASISAQQRSTPGCSSELPSEAQGSSCTVANNAQQSNMLGQGPDQCLSQGDHSVASMDAQQSVHPGRGSDQRVPEGNHSLVAFDAQQDSVPGRGPDQCVPQGNHSADATNAQQGRMPCRGTGGQQSSTPECRADQQAVLDDRKNSGLPGAHLNSMPECGPDQWVMQDTGVVVMKRGFSRETATGRLLLPKLDYLQTAVVEEALLGMRSLLRAWWQGLLRKSQRSLADASDTLAKENMEQEMGPTSLLERATRAGERAVAWLSVRGAAPIVDSMTVQDIDKAFPVIEPRRLSPLLLKVVGLKEILGAKSIFQQAPNDIAQLLIQPLELEEPTLQEIAVLYRRAQRPERRGFLGSVKSLASAIWQQKEQRARGSPPTPMATVLRPPISLQIYRDIPLPTWSVVLPEKVLQFRPLDFLRTDLFAAAGLVAALAQARYESFYLDVVTAVSASIFLIRIFLGFRRQVDRYRVRLAEILREKTVACDATAIQYMAASAADQQFAQAALCYVLLLQCQDGAAQDSKSRQGYTGIGLEALASRAEQLLAEHAGLQVCLNVDQAMGELLQRGLASTCPSAEPALEGGQAPIREEAQGSIPGMEGVSSGEQRFQAVDPRVAQQVLEKQWDSILWQRVHSTLGRVEALSDEEAEGGRERDRFQEP